MTALCGGGPSEAKPGSAAFVQVVAQILIAAAPGWSWLLPYTKFIEPLAVATETFCADDPPPLPEIDAGDVFGLVTGGRAGAGLVGIEKFAQLLRHVAWYHLCECSSVPTPAPPAALPAPPDLPTVNPSGPTATVRIVMRRDQCKVLDLWNGASNNAPPSGWQHPSFDDSGWTDPPLIDDTPDPLGTGYIACQNDIGISIPQADDATKGYPHAVGISPVVDVRSKFLIRWKFDMPYLPTSDIIIAYGGPDTPAIPESWQQTPTWVNGFAGLLSNCSNWNAQEPRWISGGTNVVAFQIAGSIADGTTKWGTEEWFAFFLEFPSGGDPTTLSDCCARLEPLLRVLEQRILAMSDLVTIIQRQHVPFAYVPGLVYAGLSGSGEVVFSDPIVRLQVELTTLPGYYGLAEGHPDQVYDVGTLALGTIDGFERPQWISHTPFMLTVPGDVTRIGYALNPGVVATIRTYSREP